MIESMLFLSIMNTASVRTAMSMDGATADMISQRTTGARNYADQHIAEAPISRLRGSSSMQEKHCQGWMRMS